MHIPQAPNTAVSVNKRALVVTLACALIFFFNALIAITILVVFIFLNKIRSDAYLIVLALLVSVFLGLVNLTKLPESDLINYLKWVQLAREVPFITFISFEMREPAYFSFLYGVANLPWTSNELFIFISTIISYMLFFGAIIRIGQTAKFDSSKIAAIIIFFAFFPPLFNNSAHLMRQFIAGSLIVCFFVSQFHNGKGNWWILIMAIFTHSTAIIFFPFMIMSRIRMLSPFPLFFLSAVLFYFVIAIAQTTAAEFVSIPYIGYIASRIAQEAYHDHSPLGVVPLVFVCGVLALSIYKLFLIEYFNVSSCRKGVANICIISTLLSLFVVIAHFFDESMLSTRFLLYIYFISSLIFMVTIRSMHAKIIFYFACFILVPAAFFWNLSHGTWTYSPLSEIVSISPLLYLLEL